MFLKAPNLSSLPSISHGFFTRAGGVSSGLYASLNCGPGTKDSTDNVYRNRSIIAEALGTKTSNLLSLSQVHGNRVITAIHCWGTKDRPEADAMVTNKPGIALGILTADCVPVLFADKHKAVIGAAHAGWKGALAGVVQETLKAMAVLGAKHEHIAAAIGPAIAQTSYEVDSAFQTAWVRDASGNAQYFIPSTRDEHFLFDLKKYIHDILCNCGISDITVLENDTYREENAFFSFRRATHRKEADYGRQISAIVIK